MCVSRNTYYDRCLRPEVLGRLIVHSLWNLDTMERLACPLGHEVFRLLQLCWPNKRALALLIDDPPARLSRLLCQPSGNCFHKRLL